jgi:hypothetical protein
MIYFKLPLLSLLLMSLMSFTHHALAADCKSIIMTTNKKLSWTIMDGSGAKIATGRIIISKVTDDGYFETRHSAGNNPAMSFYGGFHGTNLMYLNPDYQELWVGECIGNKVIGTVKNSKFEISLP